MERSFQIGELATRSGLTADALRYYERLGLLPSPRRTAGGFRVYTAGVLERLRFIKQAQTLGLTLEEIRRMVSHQDQGGVRRCRQVRDLLQSKLADLESRLVEMHQFRDTLVNHLEACNRVLARPSTSDRSSEPCCPVIETLTAKRR